MSRIRQIPEDENARGDGQGAMRHVSIPEPVLLAGSLLLGEGRLPRRLAAAVVILLGITLLATG